MLTNQTAIHNLTNLKACYNRQLPNIASIIEESTGIEWNPIKLFIKVISWFKRYVYTSFGISSDFYGELSDKTGRIG